MDKRVLFFGIFDPNYARNEVLIQGFSRLGFEVDVCSVDPKKYGSFSKYINLYKEGQKLKNTKFDHVVVAFPGHTVVWLAYLIFGRKIIFDVFVSMYNSEVEDRALHSLLSPRSFYYWLLDWYSLRLPQVLLMETDAHIKFLVDKFGVNAEKFIKVYVGSNDQVIYPQEGILTNDGMFNVVFHGTGIPLQGMEYIIDAAYELREHKDIIFSFWGDNNNNFYKKVFTKVKKFNLSNVVFHGKFIHGDLKHILNQADVVLGIFGDTRKTQLVIPNKVYEGWAAKRSIITADTPAIRELVRHEEVLLCNVADGKSIAEKILSLKEDSQLRYRVAENGYRLYYSKLRPEILVQGLLHQLETR